MGRAISGKDISFGSGAQVLAAGGRSGPVWGNAAAPITLFTCIVSGGSVPPNAILRFKGLIAKYSPNNGGFAINISAKQGANTVALGIQSLGATLGNYSFEHHVALSDDLKWGFPFSRTTNLFDTASQTTAAALAGNLYSTSGAPTSRSATVKGPIAFRSYSAPPVVETTLIDWSADVTLAVTLNPVTNDCVELVSFSVEALSNSLDGSNRASPLATLCAGDSLTAGTGATTAGVTDYVAQLGKLRPGRPVLNDGMGGQLITSIADRVLASKVAGKYWDLILWAGINDASADGAAWWATVQAQISRIKAFRAAGTRMLILNYHENTGWSAGIKTAATYVNTQMAAIYGSEVVDIATAVNGNAGYYSDAIHLNDTGYGVVASAVNSKMTANGWG